MNTILKIGIVIGSILAIISLGTISLFDDTSPQNVLTVDVILENYFDQHVVNIPSNSIFEIYYTEKDFLKYTQPNFTAPEDEAKIEFKDKNSELYKNLQPNKNTIIIYPIFTSAAYSPNGFYDFYNGNCDESCLNDISFESSPVKFTSSGILTQILYDVGYDFITDIDVDKNPEILKNYDTVILLHNEYVTKKEFDAITTHPNLIFLVPNALYAEIKVNYDNNSISLIRGHDYPPGISNGFNYEIEKRFHADEYDLECIDWKFNEIENGYHLDCTPSPTIEENIDILIKLKEL
jgi:hypothetical protein